MDGVSFPQHVSITKEKKGQTSFYKEKNKMCNYKLVLELALICISMYLCA